MLVVAAVEAVDTGPELLRISDRVPRLDAVATHRFAVDGWHVELRILAASHQVVVSDGGGGGGGGGGSGHEHVETVACGLPPAAGHALDHGAVYDHGRWRVTAEVEELAAEPFRREAAGWRRRGSADPHSVVVRFPNHPDALTALAWDGGGWTGVHLYPSLVAGGPAGTDAGGVVVRTTTTAVLVPAGRRR